MFPNNTWVARLKDWPVRVAMKDKEEKAQLPPLHKATMHEFSWPGNSLRDKAQSTKCTFYEGKNYHSLDDNAYYVSSRHLFTWKGFMNWSDWYKKQAPESPANTNSEIVTIHNWDRQGAMQAIWETSRVVKVRRLEWIEGKGHDWRSNQSNPPGLNIRESFSTPMLFWVILSAHSGTLFELKQTVEIISPENLRISTAHKTVSRLNKTVLYVQQKQCLMDEKRLRWPAMCTMIAAIKDKLQSYLQLVSYTFFFF